MRLYPFRTFLFIFLLGTFGQQTFANTQVGQAIPTTLNNWSQPSTAAQLRQSIASAGNYEQRCLHERPIQALVDTMNKADWSAAHRIANGWLQQCPIDIRIHFYAAIALTQLANDSAADKHFNWANALMDAIAASGDGRSCHSAYVTVSLSEEYDAMELFGLQNEHVAPINDGNSCDRFSVRDEDGVKSTIFFQAHNTDERLAANCRSSSRQGQENHCN